MSKTWKFLALATAAVTIAACKTTESGTSTESSGTTAAGTGSVTTGFGGGGTGTGIPALVSVNLQNVLNNLSVDLNIDRANIPVNAQVPITVAANVCGVSVSVLSVSTGGQASCTATTTSPELVQVVQQQISAGGNVDGGSQTTSPPPTPGN